MKNFRSTEETVLLIARPGFMTSGQKLQLQLVGGGQRTFYSDKPTKVPKRLVRSFLATKMVVEFGNEAIHENRGPA